MIEAEGGTLMEIVLLYLEMLFTGADESTKDANPGTDHMPIGK